MAATSTAADPPPGGPAWSRHPGAERVGTAAQVRELDRCAIEERGVPSALLMESASRACADVAESLLGGASEPALVLCGPGNNGGDGLALARTLWNRGRAVRVVRVGALCGDRDRLGVDVRLQLELLPPALERTAIDLPGPLVDRAGPAIDPAREALEGAGLVVDALFGTGLTRPLEGGPAALLERAGAASCPRLAVDLPSGLHADDGRALGPVLPCDATVSFAVWKPGLRLGEGPRLAGRVWIAEIGIPRDLVEALPTLGAAGAPAPSGDRPRPPGRAR